MDIIKRRSAVVIVQDGKVALIRRENRDRVHYVFPGGRVEENETLEDAAIREASEELGLVVRLTALLAIVTVNGEPQYYYHATAREGAFGTGHGVEFAHSADSAQGSYTPIWLSVTELCAYNVLPRQLAAVLELHMSTGTSLPLSIDEK